MKMLGRTGWYGQCSCCNGQRSKKQMRQLEKRQWRREVREERDHG